MEKANENKDNNFFKDLILKDHEASFKYIDSYHNDIARHRRLEVLFMISLIAFQNHDSIHLYMNKLQFIVGALIMTFSFLELMDRKSMLLLKNCIQRNEKLFSTRDEERILRDYEFRDTQWDQIFFTQKLKTTFACILSPRFMVWNLLMIITATVLFYVKNM